MRSSAVKTQKTATPKVLKPKELSVSDLLERHADVTLKIAFIESILDMCKENFASHDGLEPKNLVLTHDGRKVPNSVIDSIFTEIEKNMLEPLQNELKKISSIKVTK